MLASNFKTAEELGLTDAAHDAFIKVLHAMERGELKWTPRDKPIPNGFNMQLVWDERSCGTVGCIAGWARHFGLESGSFTCWGRTSHNLKALNELFTPNGYYSGLHTVEQAAHALRTYLVTGKPEWV